VARAYRITYVKLLVATAAQCTVYVNKNMLKKRETVIYWELERTFVTLNSTAAASDADTHTVCVCV